MTPIGRVLLFILVGIFLIAAWPQDKKDVKPQEPHYKNGEHNRDYHGDKNDDGDGSTEEKAAKCPFMSEAKNEGGCPYKKHREVDVADCPSFKDGCPYASGDSSKEKIKDCPAFKEGCPYKEGDHADAAIQDCPAFQGGCPYHSHKEAHYHHDCPVLRSTECPYLKGEKDLKKIADCPKFKEGCPFSDEKDMLEKAKGCPHFKEGCPFASDEKLDLSEWKNCPAFKDGCPYDTVVEHVHGHEQKLIAQEVLSAHLVGNGFDRLPSLLAENFSATLKGTLSPALKNAPLDKKAFLEFSTNIHANVKWTVTPVTVVSEGHTVVIHSRLDDKEAKDIAMVTIFHFNSEHKLESLVELFTEGQLLGFHVDPRQ